MSLSSPALRAQLGGQPSPRPQAAEAGVAGRAALGAASASLPLHTLLCLRVGFSPLSRISEVGTSEAIAFVRDEAASVEERLPEGIGEKKTVPASRKSELLVILQIQAIWLVLKTPAHFPLHFLPNFSI